MDTLERYEQQKRAVEDLRREADRKRGSLEMILGQLDEEFGCKSEEAAAKRLAKEKATASKLREEVDEELNQIEEALRGKA